MNSTITLILLVLALCGVENSSETDCNSEKNNVHEKSTLRWNGGQINSMPQYRRFKRAKYFPSVPPTFRYFRTPYRYDTPVNGAYSYTPPPNYMADDEDSMPPNRSYLTKKPSNGLETLGDDDISNLVRALSKEDIHKLLEFAGEKNKLKNSIDYPKQIDYNHPYSNHPMQWNALDVQETRQKPNFAYLNEPASQINDGFGDMISSVQAPLHFTDSRNMGEEILPKPYSRSTGEEVLPKPSNLRVDFETDYDIAYSKRMESLVRPSESYQLENVGDLPLSNENKKIKSIDSYNVPHYTVTSIPSSMYVIPKKHKVDSSEMVPEIEPAPPRSVAREQSDAHLKAVKIWTHKSTGSAYTLHDDGTLSVEKPIRPKYKTFAL